MVELTVLGSSGVWPEAGRACSGFLIESGDACLVLDLGFGTLPRLLEKVPAEDVRAVFVSHAHADHCVDLFGLYRARALPDPPFLPLPVYSLPDVLQRVGALDGPAGPSRLERECEFHPLATDETVEVGPFWVHTVELPHFVPNLGFRVEIEGLVIAYTGDTGPSHRVAELARSADLFVCEATTRDPSPTDPERNLLTATEAGRYAREAAVHRLMLTHFRPNSDRAPFQTDAAREFSGEIILAEEGKAVSLR